MDHAAIQLAEVTPIFDRCLPGPLVLAVSGGADSMALLHLVADVLETRQTQSGPSACPPVKVVTIDHGLRADSAAEAAFVAAQARARGLPHETIPWTGTKPAGGLQEAAREARYRLLARVAADWQPPTRIATAHHEDDLAETLLLRLARGSGVRGLAGMSEIAPVPLTRAERALLDPPEPRLVRPLLSFSKARLVATLRSRGLAWREDPSNADPAFERVRWRNAAADLAALGLDRVALARSARRLQRAEAALAAQASLLEGAAHYHHSGAMSAIPLLALAAAPDEVAIRVLEALLLRHGGQADPPELKQLETLHERLLAAHRDRHALTTTLGGCVLVVDPGAASVAIWRELREGRLEEITVSPGARAVWDLRYRVTAGPRLARPIRIAAIGAQAAKALVTEAHRDRPPGHAPTRFASRHSALPVGAAASLPGIFSNGALIAVPGLGGPAVDRDCDVQVELLTLGR